MKARHIVILSVFLSVAPVSFGTNASADPLWQPVQAFTDLPGVKTQDTVERENAVQCKQVIVRRDPSLDSGYATTNFCRQGTGPIFQSGRLPPSTIRQLRGFNY